VERIAGRDPPCCPLTRRRIQLVGVFCFQCCYHCWLSTLPPAFQQIDIETASNHDGSIILRMFGVTAVCLSSLVMYECQSLTFQQDGHSVLANITDFKPYFYVPVPRGFTDADIQPFREYLSVRCCTLKLMMTCWPWQHIGFPRGRQSVTEDRKGREEELVGIQRRWWYALLEAYPHGSKERPKNQRWVPLIFFSCILRNLILCRSPSVFDKGECDFRGLFDGVQLTYESNIVFTLRFMIDTKVHSVLLQLLGSYTDYGKVVGMNWIEVPAGKYKIIPEAQKRSTCQLEINVRWGRLLCTFGKRITQSFFADMTHSNHTLRRVTGQKSHPYESLASILNVLEGKVFSQKRLLIQSFKLRTWLPVKVCGCFSCDELRDFNPPFRRIAAIHSQHLHFKYLLSYRWLAGYMLRRWVEDVRSLERFCRTGWSWCRYRVQHCGIRFSLSDRPSQSCKSQ